MKKILIVLFAVPVLFTGCLLIIPNGDKEDEIVTSTFTISATTLTEDIWTDGNIAALDNEQWFNFTATDKIQYIYASNGTLSDFYVQLYNNDISTIGNKTEISGSTKCVDGTSFTVGKRYYIKVTPVSSRRGTYKIAFSKSATTPTKIKLPSGAIQLTEKTFAEGNITEKGGEQWFKFTAAADTQYIYADFISLKELNVQLYISDSDDIYGTQLGSQTKLNSSTKYTKQTLTFNEKYYIKVTPYSSSGSGTYKIAFSSFFISPALTITTLNANTWTDGSIAVPDNEYWFKFTKTDATQYIIINFDTLKNMNIQLYNIDGTTVGSNATLTTSDNNKKYTSLINNDYYIKVTPYQNYAGTYRITFSTYFILPNVNIKQLNAIDTWTDGNITEPNSEQWFQFSVTTTDIHYIIINFGSLENLFIQLSDSDGNTITSGNLHGRNNIIANTLYAGEVYYIKVVPYPKDSTGSFKITFNTSAIPPPL